MRARCKKTTHFLFTYLLIYDRGVGGRGLYADWTDSVDRLVLLSSGDEEHDICSAGNGAGSGFSFVKAEDT